MTRYGRFLLLVQTAALERALKAGQAGSDSAAPTLARAMEIAPRCVPADLDHAVWAVIEWLMCGGERPAWVRERRA